MTILFCHVIVIRTGCHKCTRTIAPGTRFALQYASMHLLVSFLCEQHYLCFNSTLLLVMSVGMQPCSSMLPFSAHQLNMQGQHLRHSGALQGNLISYFENSFIRTASRHEDVPELTDLQQRALKAVEDLADSVELRMDYVLQPGDIQLLHNHSIVHARTAFVDHDDVSASTNFVRMADMGRSHVAFVTL